MKEIYISVDIEADGRIPGTSSMLSIGAAAFIEEGDCLGTFYVNLEQLDGAVPDASSMEWWATQPKAWAALQEDKKSPQEAMESFCEWTQTFPGRPVFVAYPTGFDFTFVYWYAMKFCPDKWPFAWAALDIRTLAMALGNSTFSESTKRNWPKRWKTKIRHTHIAVDDAIGQGEEFIKMLRELRTGTK
jgi:DNA polymerase III alpha subunit (gram-positive type)